VQYKLSKYELIKEDYLNGMSIQDIMIKYNYKSDSSIYEIFRKLNLKTLKNKKWTKEQINILKDKYNYEDWNILLELLSPFNKKEIMHKAYKLKLKREIYFWSIDELSIIINYYENIPIKQIMTLLPNKSYYAIISKANELNLLNRKPWTSEEIIYFKEIYPKNNIYNLMKIFNNRTRSSIESMARLLKLHKKDNYKEISIENKKEELLEQLKIFATELGRTPMQIDFCNNKNVPGAITYNRYFDSYSNACKLAGLKINLSKFGNNEIYYSNNNDICYSIGEQIITNYFIKYKIPYIKELLYRDLINDKKCGLKRVDWVIFDNIIVEFFGMYGRDDYNIGVQEKINICKDNNVKLIDIYFKNLNNLDNIFKCYIN